MKQRLLKMLSLSILFCISFATVAFAEDTNVFAHMPEWWQALGKGYSIFRAIAIPIATVGFVICAIQLFTLSEKAAEKAKANMFRLVIAVIAILVLPLILSSGISMFGKFAWNPDSTQNDVGISPARTMSPDAFLGEPPLEQESEDDSE